MDSQDLSLNISREMLQHDRQLKAIAQRLEKKIKSELLAMLKTDQRKICGSSSRISVCSLNTDSMTDLESIRKSCQDLVMFYSSTEKDACHPFRIRQPG